MKIIAIITEATCLPACLDAAVIAARIDADACVEALYIVVDPEKLIAASEEIQFQRLREAREGTAQERARAVNAAFAAWAAATDPSPPIEWKTSTGAEEESVVRETAAADLLVLAHGHNLDTGDALHAAIRGARKPILLVPADWRPRSPTFAHVAVALSDTPIAADAIAGAMPWLHAAQKVTALRIGSESDSALGLVDALTTAGIVSEPHVVPLMSDNRGAQIVEEAEAIGADMLVAGAYRHGPLVEWLMGGTTRHMLAAARLPLFLEH